MGARAQVVTVAVANRRIASGAVVTA